jgi:hypothetical protein
MSSDWRALETQASSPIVSKAEAAAALGLERSTFTMMLKRGAIGGAAIVGEGYHARINLEAARAQIRKSASS